MPSITNAQVIFINGIFNEESNVKETCKRLQSVTKIPVDYIWNPSRLDGIFFSDKNSSVKDTPLVLAKKIGALMDAKKYLCIICHSKGAHITYKALQELSTRSEDLKKYVQVHSFGGICLISTSMVNKAINYYSSGKGWCSNRIVDFCKDYGASQQFLSTDPTPTWEHYHDGKLDASFKAMEIICSARNSLHLHAFSNSYEPMAKQLIKEFEHTLEQKAWQQKAMFIIFFVCASVFIRYLVQTQEQLDG